MSSGFELKQGHVNGKLVGLFFDSDSWPNITNVKHNDDFTEFTITLKSESMTLFDAFAPMAVGLPTCMYQQALDAPMNCHIVIMCSDGSQLG